MGKYAYLKTDLESVDAAHARLGHLPEWKEQCPLLRVLIKKTICFLNDNVFDQFIGLGPEWVPSDGSHSTLTPEVLQRCTTRLLPMQTLHGAGEFAVFTRAVLELPNHCSQRYQTICCSPCWRYHGYNRMVCAHVLPFPCVLIPFCFRFLPFSAVFFRVRGVSTNRRPEHAAGRAGYGLVRLPATVSATIPKTP